MSIADDLLRKKDRIDEAKQKMCKCKDIVLLEDVLCSGRQKLYFEDCDRCCFYFWHKDWLVSLEAQGAEPTRRLR